MIQPVAPIRTIRRIRRIARPAPLTIAQRCRSCGQPSVNLTSDRVCPACAVVELFGPEAA